jgi:XTP/dITP diphosphohydrolase
VRRHPHVFADVEADTADVVAANWDEIKAQEKEHRTHPLEGVPVSLPALARAEKYVSRLERAGRSELVDEQVGVGDVGGRLLDVVRRARADGIDAEGALRETLRRLAVASEGGALSDDAPSDDAPSEDTSGSA